MEQESTRQKNLGELTLIIEKKLAGGVPRVKVLDEMLGEGLDQKTAEDLVNHIEAQVKAEFGHGSTRDVFWGLAVFVIGLGITIGTYRAAGMGGS